MSHPRDERLVEAFVERAERDLAIMSEEQLDKGWERLQRPHAAPPRRTKPSLRLGFGLATALAAAALVVAAYRFVPDRAGAPLRYSVEGAASVAASTITAAGEAKSWLRFSDESRIELAARTTVTVDALAENGAQVTLVDGAIEVFVKPRSHSAWTFAAGPFQVKVKGTSFRLGYSGNHGRMSLHMTSGLVEVVGSKGRTMAVSAGESLELAAAPTLAAEPDGENAPAQTPFPEQRPTPPSEVPDQTAVGIPAKTAVEPAHRRSPGHGKNEPETSTAGRPPEAWSRLITQGRYADVIAEAERRGLDATLAEADAADLSSLADAARYTKHPDLARRVLLVMRTRFVGTEPARDASFFLGRLGERVPGQPEVALGWYETYLREAPRGLYASEALAREMTLLAAKEPRRAAKLARLYLERFPHGSQAELARSLLETGND